MKYYDNSEEYRTAYFSSRYGAEPTNDMTIAKSVLNNKAYEGGARRLVVSFSEYVGSPGFFGGSYKSTLRHVNFTKIKMLSIVSNKELISAGIKLLSNKWVAKLELVDGTRLWVVGTSPINQCGLSKTGKDLDCFTTQWIEERVDERRFGGLCQFDQALADANIESKPGNIKGESALALLTGQFSFRVSESEPVRFDWNEPITRYFEHGEAAKVKFDSCFSAFNDYQSWEKVRNTRYAEVLALAKAAEEQAAANKQAEQARRQAEQARNEAILEQRIKSETRDLRAHIKVGSLTNCGQVFDVKMPMIGVQTMIGMQYIDVQRLFSPLVGCKFVNGQYTGTGSQ